MTDLISIRAETPDDIAAIADVHRDAFGTSEPIPELVNRLRDLRGAFPTVSLLAETKGQVTGHVMVSHAWLDAPRKMIDVMVLSPLGVRTDFQGQGIGTALIKAALNAADDLKAPLIFLEGNPKYYGPRGFMAAGSSGFHRPSLRIPEPAFQVVMLASYAPDMIGTLVYRDIFWELDCVGLRK